MSIQNPFVGKSSEKVQECLLIWAPPVLAWPGALCAQERAWGLFPGSPTVEMTLVPDCVTAHVQEIQVTRVALS